MRGALAIARHEIAQRWMWPVAALALGAIPLLLSLLSAAPQREWLDGAYRYNLSYFVLYALTRLSWVAAAVIGFALVGRPLHDGKLSFLFTRPFSAPAIACGKLLGGVALVVVSESLVLGPTAIYTKLALPTHRWRYIQVLAPEMGLEIAIACVLLGIGLVAGVLARSRSRWFAIDVAGALVTGTAGVMVVSRIRTIGEWFDANRWFAWLVGDRLGRLESSLAVWDVRSSYYPSWESPADTQRWCDNLDRARDTFYTNVDRLALGIVVATSVAMVVAAGAAVIAGRSDRERAHAALSTTLWSSLAFVGVVAVAVAQWGLV